MVFLKCTLEKGLEGFQQTLNEWLHEIAFVTSTMSDLDAPQSLQEAWLDPDLIAREKWQEAICLEFKKMLEMGVWRHVKRRDHPQDHRMAGCRCVFKVKRNGVYHAILVSKGFSQISLAVISQITTSQW